MSSYWRFNSLIFHKNYLDYYDDYDGGAGAGARVEVGGGDAARDGGFHIYYLDYYDDYEGGAGAGGGDAARDGGFHN